MMFNFTRNFGDTYGNGAFAGYSVQLGKRAELGLQGGFFRLESLGLTTVQVDPVIAALIGASSVQEVFYSKIIMPTAQVNFTYRVNRIHSLNVGGGISAMPGNGIINTSRMTNFGGNYTFSGIRDWGLSAGANYMRMASLIGVSQVFETVQLSVNASRRISNQIFFSTALGNRKFLGSQTNSFRRNSYFISAGLTWSPREVPVSIR